MAIITITDVNFIFDTATGLAIGVTPQAGIPDVTYLANEVIKTDSMSVNDIATTTDKILSNNTATNCTVTVPAGAIPQGAVLQQLSTGTVTVVAGAGVTFIGSTLSTSAPGQQISLIKTNIANTFIVKVA